VRILVVEDEGSLRDGIVDLLAGDGHGVTAVADGAAGLETGLRDPFDIVVLDLMLPKLDGIEVCRRLRSRSQVPLVMLTAKGDEIDKVVGLELGADDYLTKPFSMREVVARVAALLRRVERATALAEERPAALSVGAITIDPGTRRTTVAGEAVHLTPTEFDLLLCLAREAGQVLGRDRLLREVWDWGDAWGSASAARTVDSHVKALRSKVGATRIRTVHGVGYALEDVS
jgi:DNA-binding response OmpR family regulator